MIYYIVPPIIFVVSLVALIHFLYRKTDLLKQEISRTEGEPQSQTGLKLKNFSLSLSEKLTRRIKLIFLKFYNFLDKVSQRIREKRNQEKKVFQSSAEEKEPVFERQIKEEFKIKKEVESVFKVQPMVSRKVVKPEAKKDKKSQLEQILIGRIAANPRDIEAYERLGDYYIENESWEDARECFKQVLKLSPINRKARMRIKSLEKRILGW